MPNQQFQNQPSAANTPAPKTPEPINPDRLATYEVYDSSDNHIGTATAVWIDLYNQPAFLGVKTSRLFARTHVIPAWGAEVNHAARRICIPCPRSVIDEAPIFSPGEDLDEISERQVLDYFKAKGACQPTAQVPEPAAEETIIPLNPEEVKAGEYTLQTGGLRLRKIIRSETTRQPAELSPEEIQSERAPAREQRQPSEKPFQEPQDIYIPLRHEEPVVEKQSPVRQKLRALMTAATGQQTASAEARPQEAQLEREQDRRKAA